jgi:lysophospholipase L1-like esterase
VRKFFCALAFLFLVETARADLISSVALPEGNYDVTVTFGNPTNATTTSVFAESRRLMFENIQTAPGQTQKRAFTVNIRRPEISTGGRVKLKDRERSYLHWDDKLTLRFVGDPPLDFEIHPATNAITVYIAGDSTVTDQPTEPWNSWGQMLTRFFKQGVAIANHAESGESIKSSLGAGRFQKIFSAIKPGDYLLLQFGHNDMKDKAPDALATYRANLEKICAEAQSHGATVILITSMERKAGVNKETLGEYPQTVRDVAKAKTLALIDLHAMSKELYRALGSNLDMAFQDGTHHNNYGSYELAKCVVQGIRESGLPLAKQIVDDFKKFDPAYPDPAPAVAPVSVSSPKPDGN